DLAGPELGGAVHHAGIGVGGGLDGAVVRHAGVDAAYLHGLGGGRLPAEDRLHEAGHARPVGGGGGGDDERAVGLVTPDHRLPGRQAHGARALGREAPAQLAERDVDVGVGGL